MSKVSAAAIASLHRWYVATGLLPDDSGKYRVKRSDVAQPTVVPKQGAKK